MSDLVSWVNVENVEVIDLLRFENLDAGSSTRYNQRDKGKKSEDVFGIEPEVVVDCLAYCQLSKAKEHK